MVDRPSRCTARANDVPHNARCPLPYGHEGEHDFGEAPTPPAPSP